MQTPSKSRKRRLPAAAIADAQRTRQIARQEMAIGLMSLFRPLPDGAARREVRIEQRFAGGMVRVMGVEMSQFEQAVFLALLAIAGMGEPVLQTALDAGLLPLLPHPNAPAAACAERNIAATAQAVEIKTTLAELCRVAGLPDRPGSGTREAIKLALQRMAGVTIYAEGAGGTWGITHLMSGSIGAQSGSEGSVIVRLNPRSTAAALGMRSYAPVSMTTYRALPTPTARVLYAWLCAWFNGRTGTREIGIEALERHVFGAVAKDRRRRSQRRGQIKAALVAIGKCDGLFLVSSSDDGTAITITRQFGGGDVRPAADNDTPSGGQSPSEKWLLQVAPTSRGSG